MKHGKKYVESAKLIDRASFYETEEEIANMGFLAEAEASPFSIGDHVIVTEGVWQDTDGVVQEVHPAKQMAVIVIDMFGRDTPVEIDFSELKLV